MYPAWVRIPVKKKGWNFLFYMFGCQILTSAIDLCSKQNFPFQEFWFFKVIWRKLSYSQLEPSRLELELTENM